jgi:hypothetical protein
MLNVIVVELLDLILALLDEMVTYVLLVIIERLSAVDEKLVVESLLVPDTKMVPLPDVFILGVKVAVYVDPLMSLATVDKLPPSRVVIKELLNLVVAVLIVNVIVAVCPA